MQSIKYQFTRKRIESLHHKRSVIEITLIFDFFQYYHIFAGTIVIPNIIYLFQTETFHPKSYRLAGEFPDIETFGGPFYDVAGFFTILTISVSGYSLAASSLDR